MYYERFIAGRYLHSGRFFTSVSTWITTLGVTLGVAVVCFVMSMHNGFESELRKRLLGTTSHITIFPRDSMTIHDYRDLIARVEKIPSVVAASPFIYYKAAISSASSGDGIVIRAINPDEEKRTSNIADDIIKGKYSFDLPSAADTSEGASGMLMGAILADRMGVNLGDPVVLYSLRGEDLRRSSRPRVAKFYISGIFETGMYEFDAELAYISLASAQRLFQMDDEVTAVHLKLTDIYLANKVDTLIRNAIGYGYDVVPWNVLHKNLFTWIALEKKILFIGFILIVLVAAFSIISALVMLAMEKRSEIGILKTIGSTPASVRRIFIYNGLVVGGIGIIIGWGLALGAAWIQNKYALISLPPDLYFISYLPIEVHPLDFVFAGIITIIICFLAALYPAQQAARQSVIDVLRQ
ncbi:MAG: ABC transporter permease [candidate division Zixibacteria bacterium]|nr:ABC transporter permease [candidate division Zixibacteria bacterium]